MALISAGCPDAAGKFVLLRSANGGGGQHFSLKDVVDGKWDHIVLHGGDVVMVTSAPPATQPGEKNVYYISGVPRTGVYSLKEPVNMLQALVAAGVNPPDVQDRQIVWTHATGSRGISYLSVKNLLNGSAGPTVIGEFDQIQLTDEKADPATQPASPRH
jgi:hypothetical protein